MAVTYELAVRELFRERSRTVRGRELRSEEVASRSRTASGSGSSLTANRVALKSKAIQQFEHKKVDRLLEDTRDLILRHAIGCRKLEIPLGGQIWPTVRDKNQLGRERLANRSRPHPFANDYGRDR